MQVLIGTAFTLILSLSALGFRINTTASEPIGLWHVQPINSLESGTVVEVCLPDTSTIQQAKRLGILTSGFCASGTGTVLKTVAGLPGDRYTVNAHGLQIKNRFYLAQGPFDKLVSGQYTIQPGQVMLLNSHPHSLDSRYLGSVPISAIQGEATHLWW